MKSVWKLIAQTKNKPGALNCGSSGIGAPNHLALEMLQVMTGTEMTHVPYKSAAPSVTELMGGQVQLSVNAIPSVLQAINLGKLTALAVISPKRSRVLPNVPMLAAAGAANVDYAIWYSLFAPARVAPDIVNNVSTDLQRALKDPDLVQQLTAQGTEPAPSSAAAARDTSPG